jgi:hypothetical protein
MAEKILRFKVYLQKPKPCKKAIIGSLCLANHDHRLQLWSNIEDVNEARIEYELLYPELVFANSHGIMLKGYEPTQVTKTGLEKTTYQEWWCVNG